MAITATPVDPSRYFRGLGNTSGLQQGAFMVGQGLAQRRQQQEEEQRMARARELQQARLNEAAGVLQSGNSNLMADYMLKNPDMREALMKSQNFVNEATRQKRIESAMRIVRGEPSTQVAQETAQFIDMQGGDSSDTRAFGNLSQEQAEKVAMAELSYLMEPQQFKNFMAAIRGGQPASTDGRTAGMKDFDYFQQLKKSDPEAARAFGQERGFITKEGRELSGHMQKRLSSATDEAIEAEQNVGQYNVIADDIEAADIGGGLFGATWKEGLKEITGTQDAVSDLRRKYAGIRASQVVNNLPPGAASDKDIEMAMGGFPGDKASGEQIASFMRGLAKLEQMRADYANFRADYISENGSERGMLKAWKDQQPRQTQPQASIDDLVSKYAD